MTTIVPRRSFDEDEFDEDKPEESRRRSKTAEELRELGLIRSACIVSIDLNESIKKMARCQGKNADELMGQFVESSSEVITRWKAEQRAKELREEFGEDWIFVLRNASPEHDVLSITEALAMLRIGKTALYERMGEAGIKPVRHGGRAWITSAHLEQLREYGREWEDDCLS